MSLPKLRSTAHNQNPAPSVRVVFPLDPRPPFLGNSRPKILQYAGIAEATMAEVSFTGFSKYSRGRSAEDYVGPKRRTFTVYKVLLRDASNFFKEQIRPSGYISDLSYVFLSTYDPNAFHFFVTWLYRGTPMEVSKQTTHEQQFRAKLRVSRLVDLYVMARTWDVCGLIHLIVDSMRARKTCNSGWFHEEFLKKIYEGTEHEDPLRRFVLGSVLYKSWDWTMEERVEFLKVHVKGGNVDFVLELYDNLDTLFREKLGSKKPVDPSTANKCGYHWYHDNSECED